MRMHLIGVLGILSICAAVTIAAAGQGTAFRLARFGKPAITDADVVQIADLLKDTGKPWLLRSASSMIGGVRIADVFLEPNALAARVSRGRMMKLVAGETSPWSMKEWYAYAYIPTEGRSPGDIRGEADTNWPFIVEGALDDATLISIVEFIRTEPHVPVRAFLQKVPAGPIYSIRNRGDDFTVGFHVGSSVSHTVWLARKGAQWVITRSESSIA